MSDLPRGWFYKDRERTYRHGSAIITEGINEIHFDGSRLPNRRRGRTSHPRAKSLTVSRSSLLGVNSGGVSRSSRRVVSSKRRGGGCLERSLGEQPCSPGNLVGEETSSPACVSPLPVMQEGEWLETYASQLVSTTANTFLTPINLDEPSSSNPCSGQCCFAVADFHVTKDECREKFIGVQVCKVYL